MRVRRTTRGWLGFLLGWVVLGAWGLRDAARGAELIGMESAWRWQKGTAEASAPDPAAWRQRGFDDRSWNVGAAPFFYGEPLTGTVLNDMRGGYTSVYLRSTFVVSDASDIASLSLRALSDDGFIAWINGREIVRFNVRGGDVRFDETSLQSFNEPLPIETYEIGGFRDFLVPGTNVLAVHAFNVSLANSSDFIFQAALDAAIDDAPPVVESLSPSAGARVRDLTQVQVTFSEPVDGVDAADLRVNGVAASRLTPFGPDLYIFEFPAAPRGTVTMSWVSNHGIQDRSSRRLAFGGGTWTYIVDPDLPQPGVTITEFMADNDRTLNDEDGDASDWIEIHNASEQTVSLAGWSLTDSANQPRRWVFPPVSLVPRGFLVVFASGKNRTNVTGRLHTNFRLGAGGGYLGLYRPGGSAASEFGPEYPAQLEDVSYGTLPNDPLQKGFFPQPTPGKVNAEGGPGFAPEVEFSRIGGAFTAPFELRLSAPGAVVRYTLDGSVPTAQSPAYDPAAPLSIASSTRVRARAFAPGLLPGPLKGEYYVQLTPAGAAVTSTLPLVLIHSFGRGNVPANGEYPAFLAIHEPRGGAASMTNAPDLRTRARLNIRGSSTLGQSKRNYSVEFRDEREADRDLAPLGMPADSDWVLYAPNNFEPILIHNPLAFAMSREMGQYAPRTRFVEVYIQTGTGAVANTQYAGIYVLMEKIKRGSDRVAIDNLEPEHLTAPSVTGGYLLKIDRLDPGDGGLYAGGQVMGFVDPKEEEMQTPQRAPQRDYIQGYLDQFGTALYSANWRDPVRGWRAYVDERSWIDHHILNVLCFNVDALRLSAYFYKPRNGKLVFGPPWDFDRALYSTDGRDQNARVWRSAISDMGTDFFNYPWWGRMMEDPDFWQAWIDRYQELRAGAFSTNRLHRLIDDLVAEVRPAQPREAARWPGFTTPRISYESEVTSLKGWLGRRLEFMDTNFLASPALAVPAGTVTAGTRVALSGPTGSTLYYTTDGTDPRASGGAVASSARVYNAPIAIDATTTLRARAFRASHRNLTGPNNPPISSSWSGVVAARYTLLPSPEPGSLVLTELQYHPAEPTAAESAQVPGVTASDFEYLELRNAGPAAVDLGGLRFTDGIDFSFRTSAIPALASGERLLIVRNRAAFVLRHGASPRIAGEFSGGLDSNGETLRIRDAQDRLILEATYRNGWHPATDGLGFTLVAVDESGAAGWPTRPEAWRPSAGPGGSPGLRDPPAPDLPVVVIHEALTHTDLPQRDAVELRNLSAVPAAIGHWFLTDDRSVPAKYRFPAGTVIPPGGFLWVDESEFNADTNAPSSFRLDSLGDAIWLFAADAQGRLLGPAHGFAFGAAANGVSFGREVGCDGTEWFVAQAAVTPAGPNAGPLLSPVVVTEVHYHPPDIVLGPTLVDDTALEFIEVANVGATPVELSDSARPTNTWRIKDAVGFRFPPGVVLGPGRTLVVVNFDPARNPAALARFQSAFGPPLDLPLFGPFEGSLSNAEGAVELARPDPPQLPTDPQAGFVPSIVVDRVAYRDRAPWPVLADGGGRSLHRVRFDGVGSEARSWVALPPTPGRLPAASLDSDADGMADAWEAAHCLDPGDPADALLDPDGDGANNRDEFLAGTDPHGTAVAPSWLGIAVTDAGIELRFRARAGATYTVQYADELGGAATAWRRLSNLPTPAGETVLTVRDPATGPGPRFYRLVTPALP